MRRVVSRAFALARRRRRCAEPSLPSNEVVAADVGTLLMRAEDRVMLPAIAAAGEWEHEEAALFRTYLAPGMVVVDVGANVGYYTLLSGRAVGRRGRVIAVEPDAGNVALLRENVARNRLANVEVVPAAAWLETARLLLEPNELNPGDHQVRAASGRADARAIDGVALDDLLADANVAVVKIDAQGSDHRALAGMERTVRACRSIVFIEFWPQGIRALGDDPAQAFDFIRSFGRVAIPGVPTPFSEWPSARVVDMVASLPGGFATFVVRPEQAMRLAS
jgi:FkbM family methyltransferase